MAYTFDNVNINTAFGKPGTGRANEWVVVRHRGSVVMVAGYNREQQVLAVVNLNFRARLPGFKSWLGYLTAINLNFGARLPEFKSWLGYLAAA